MDEVGTGLGVLTVALGVGLGPVQRDFGVGFVGGLGAGVYGRLWVVLGCGGRLGRGASTLACDIFLGLKSVGSWRRRWESAGGRGNPGWPPGGPGPSLGSLKKPGLSWGKSGGEVVRCISGFGGL